MFQLPNDILSFIIDLLDKSSKTAFSFVCLTKHKVLFTQKVRKCELIIQIIKDNHFGLLKWADDFGCSFQKNSSSHYIIAIDNNNLEIFKWLKENGCPWDEFICCDAAAKNRLEILKWTRVQNPPCPWDEDTCSEAAFGGHFEILKWARENNCPWDEDTCSSAHLEVLRSCLYAKSTPPRAWAKENNCP